MDQFDASQTIADFLEATEDYPDSEYNTALINIKAMRRLCEDYRDLFEYAAELEYVLGQDWNRPKDCISQQEAERRVHAGLVELRRKRCRHVRTITRLDMTGRTTCTACGTVFPGPILAGLDTDGTTSPEPDLRGTTGGSIAP